jgi:hypothetical protein
MASFLDMFPSFYALSVIFKLGFVPEDDEFHELTPEQYLHFYATAAEEKDRVSKERIYMLLPKDPQKYEPFAGNEVFVFREREVIAIRDGERIIESYCTKSEKKFDSFDEKLCYCATLMPDAFSEGTKYECYRKGFKSI